jgi:hypothetical protein
VIQYRGWGDFKWPEIKDEKGQDKETPWAHQVQCGEEMVARMGQNHILWVTPGLGNFTICWI